MHQKDTVGYWRIHCKEARRKVATLEIQNKAMREALEYCLSTLEDDVKPIRWSDSQYRDEAIEQCIAALAKAKGESE